MVYEIIGAHGDSLLFAATELGPFVYVNEEQRWFELGMEAPDQVYWSVDYIPATDVVRFGTHGRGIWDFRIQVDEPPVSTEDFSRNLDLNVYPNPASTRVNLEHVRPGTAEIWDANGRVVWRSSEFNRSITIDVSSWSSGTYTVQWKDMEGTVEAKPLLINH